LDLLKAYPPSTALDLVFEKKEAGAGKLRSLQNADNEKIWQEVPRRAAVLKKEIDLQTIIHG
jgi:hypothetical protein